MNHALRFDLPVRLPYDWSSLLDFLGQRAIDGVESVDQDAYHRTLRVRVDPEGPAGSAECVGWVCLRADLANACLRLTCSESLRPVAQGVCARMAFLADAACDPEVVSRALGRIAARYPGLRVPGAVDGFELVVRAVLGQQITVRAARTLAGRFAATFGATLDDGELPRADDGVRLPSDAAPADGDVPSALNAAPRIGRALPAILFPRADQVALASVGDIASLGIIAARAEAILELARNIAEGRLDLQPGAAPEACMTQLTRIRGLGEWTAQYVALRALGWRDAFPHGDLALRKALGAVSAREALQISEAWRPWRAYAAMHLWRAGARPGKA